MNSLSTGCINGKERGSFWIIATALGVCKLFFKIFFLNTSYKASFLDSRMMCVIIQTYEKNPH